MLNMTSSTGSANEPITQSSNTPHHQQQHREAMRNLLLGTTADHLQGHCFSAPSKSSNCCSSLLTTTVAANAVGTSPLDQLIKLQERLQQGEFSVAPTTSNHQTSSFHATSSPSPKISSSNLPFLPANSVKAHSTFPSAANLSIVSPFDPFIGTLGSQSLFDSSSLVFSTYSNAAHQLAGPMAAAAAASSNHWTSSAAAAAAWNWGAAAATETAALLNGGGASAVAYGSGGASGTNAELSSTSTVGGGSWNRGGGSGVGGGGVGANAYFGLLPNQLSGISNVDLSGFQLANGGEEIGGQSQGQPTGTNLKPNQKMKMMLGNGGRALNKIDAKISGGAQLEQNSRRKISNGGEKAEKVSENMQKPKGGGKMMKGVGKGGGQNGRGGGGGAKGSTANCECPNCMELVRTAAADGLPSRKHAEKHSCHIPGCHKVYSKSSHLKAHLRWHSVERPPINKRRLFDPPEGEIFLRNEGNIKQ